MRFQDKRVTFGSKISDRVWKDNNGQLICHDCILSRTGYYDYLESDILVDGDPSKVVQVYRTPEEVFNPESIASFENKPFCNDHPEEDVTPLNYKDLQVGYVRNIRRGEGDLDDCLIGDIIVTDQDVIDLILSGEKRQLSLGYDSVIEKDASGRYLMKKIRGNHLALVDEGRAGCATIRDKSTVKNNLGGRDRMKKSLFKTKTKLYDEDIIEVEEIEETPIVSEETTDDYDLEEIKEKSPEDVEEIKDEEESPLAGVQKKLLDTIVKRLDEVEARLSKLETPTTDDDDTIEETEEVVEDEDDVEEDLGDGDDLDTEEEITDEDDIESEENTLLDADEEIEEEEKVSKKTDKALRTYSKCVGTRDSKNRDQAIERASIAAWKKRYNIK